MQKKSQIKEMPTWLMWLFPVLVVLMLVVFSSFGSGNSAAKLEAKSKYPGPWVSSAHPELNRALLARGVTGCGQFEYRASIAIAGEYLVACSRDGKSWLAYLVWPAVTTVTGPMQMPVGITPPVNR